MQKYNPPPRTLGEMLSDADRAALRAVGSGKDIDTIRSIQSRENRKAKKRAYRLAQITQIEQDMRHLRGFLTIPGRVRASEGGRPQPASRPNLNGVVRTITRRHLKTIPISTLVLKPGVTKEQVFITLGRRFNIGAGLRSGILAEYQDLSNRLKLLKKQVGPPARSKKRTKGLGGLKRFEKKRGRTHSTVRTEPALLGRSGRYVKQKRK